MAWMMSDGVASGAALATVPTPARAGGPHGANQDGGNVDMASAPGVGSQQGDHSAATVPGLQPMLGGMPMQQQQPLQPPNHQQGQVIQGLRFSWQQIQQMFPLMVIGHLQQQQAIDVLNAGNLTTVIFLKVNPYIASMLNVQRNYGAAVRRDGPQHDHGSLSVHLFGQTLNFLVASQQVGGKSDMQAVLQDARDGNGRKELEKHVSSFKVTKLYDQSKMRVQFQLCSDCSAEVEAIGGVIKNGVAPRGAIQRRLQEFVDAARNGN